MVYELRRRIDTVDDRLPEDLLKEYNLYVTCQIGDDVPYLLGQAGEGALMIGTDYGHADSSTELEALTSLKERRRHQRRDAHPDRGGQPAGVLRAVVSFDFATFHVATLRTNGVSRREALS